MSEIVGSDTELLDLLRKHDAMTVAELAECLQVTPTAVRQRLHRLMGQGLVDRVAVRLRRGRPAHRYGLTAKGRRQTGGNFTDLAIVLWQQLRQMGDRQLRRGLLQSLAKRLAAMYASRIEGLTVEQRMKGLVRLFAERRVPLAADFDGQLPVLTALACPYAELAEEDRGICAMERMMFSEILGRDVGLSECRLDGGNQCSFQVRPALDRSADEAPAPAGQTPSSWSQ